MVIQGKLVVEEDILSSRFACDVGRCKGACCTLPGGRGAPLADAEVEELRKAFPAVKEYLPERSLGVIAAHGMAEGTPGEYYTTCIDDKDCVFVLYEDGIARCAVEKAFFAGKTSWQKPMSCHLFPVRITRDGSRMHYERIGECLPGIDRGMKEDIPLAEFLRAPLVRKFGASWYEAFLKECPPRPKTEQEHL